MKITYLGHSCFLFEAQSGTRLLTDPYGDVGFSLPRVSADVVTVSHAHYDHNNVAGVAGAPHIVDRAGKSTFGGVSVEAIPSFHDDVRGAKRGRNLIMRFEMDGITVCHMGDIGEPCSAELVKKLVPINVLLIPVGGNYTVGAAQAKEYADRIAPNVVIPMHYKCKGLTVDVGPLDAFSALYNEKNKVSGTLELTFGEIVQSERKIYIMERV